VIVAVTGVLAAVAVVVVIASSGSSGTTPTTARTSASSTSGKHQRRTLAANSSITVAVLNGTATNGLAHRISVRLTTAGFKADRVTNTGDQEQTTTAVEYAPRQKADATAVAKMLRLGSKSVHPIGAGVQTIACGQVQSCRAATVVVTVGADLAAR
jgi:hypothetical protein